MRLRCGCKNSKCIPLFTDHTSTQVMCTPFWRCYVCNYPVMSDVAKYTRNFINYNPSLASINYDNTVNEVMLEVKV